ncbi:MAG: ribosome biogenesis GTPase YlqF [Tissierellales bacterium]|nr:ribosome biogenesis GTPase YlqF [Tissierellales bacterium]MBN2827975.1 ribosome biogenesis GTPase YlqF [Tissierellales bacterium]
MSINWFPGHMKKTGELIKDNLKLVDLIIEIVDARIPKSSRNPMLDSISNHKHHIIILNKSDLADPIVSEKWVANYTRGSTKCMLYNATKDSELKFYKEISDIAEEIKQKYKLKGFHDRQLRAMIVGIPNVGKSTFINKISKRKGTVTGDKPGVTKGKQWIRIKSGMDLLDTPGILWPKIETDEQGYRLAATGAIKDEILNKTQISLFILDYLVKNYHHLLFEKYAVEISDDIQQILTDIALKNGCILKGNKIDYDRVERMIINDFRKGSFGRISLERP